MNLLQIERIFYPIETLGYGKRIGIWTIGCSHGCFNCCNPELWDSNPNKNLSLLQIFTMLKSINQPVDGVTISGGDPFQQLEELDELVSFIAAEITDDILIYTGFTRNSCRTGTMTMSQTLSKKLLFSSMENMLNI